MKMPEKRITDFIKKHHVLTLATCIENKPWCSNCFYAYEKTENFFVFTSDMATKHIQDAIQNVDVAGSVVLETRIIGKIQGIQFTGKLLKADGRLLDLAKAIYLKRFPFAALMETTLWVLIPNLIKMTDNRLGFGKKLIWKAEEIEQ
jgi:uncharacterized protein